MQNEQSGASVNKSLRMDRAGTKGEEEERDGIARCENCLGNRKDARNSHDVDIGGLFFWWLLCLSWATTKLAACYLIPSFPHCQGWNDPTWFCTHGYDNIRSNHICFSGDKEVEKSCNLGLNRSIRCK